MLGDSDAARSVLTEACELCRELEEPLLEARARFFQGLAETFCGAIETGRTHLQASRALHHELGVATGEARAILGLGMGYAVSDEPDRAKDLFETALSLLVSADDDHSVGLGGSAGAFLRGPARPRLRAGRPLARSASCTVFEVYMLVAGGLRLRAWFRRVGASELLLRAGAAIAIGASR